MKTLEVITEFVRSNEALCVLLVEVAFIAICALSAVVNKSQRIKG